MAPPITLLRLIGLGVASIEDAAARLEATGNVKAWRAEMERIITTQHTATQLAATAERLGLPADSPLIGRNRLTRAERNDIKAAVRNQLEYLDKFTAEIRAGNLSPAQIAQRAALYGRAVQPFYYQQRSFGWVIPDNILPGNQTCLGNCTCRLSDVVDNNDGTGTITRTLGATERHCTECPGLAGDHIVRRRT
jgi:hypothetical protein